MTYLDTPSPLHNRVSKKFLLCYFTSYMEDSLEFAEKFQSLNTLLLLVSHCYGFLLMAMPDVASHLM